MPNFKKTKYLSNPKNQKTPTLILVMMLIIGLLILMYILPFARFVRMVFEDQSISKLEKYNSKDGTFSILLPEKWLIYETSDGMSNDPDIILEAIRPWSEAPLILFARSKIALEDMNQVIQWGEKRAQGRGAFSLQSSKEYSSNKYQGQILRYRLDYINHPESSFLCNEWLFSKNQIGYGFALCERPERADAPGKYFPEIINSIELLEN